MDPSLYLLSALAKTTGLCVAILGTVFVRDAFVTTGLILMLASWYLLDYYYKKMRLMHHKNGG